MSTSVKSRKLEIVQIHTKKYFGDPGTKSGSGKEFTILYEFVKIFKDLISLPPKLQAPASQTSCVIRLDLLGCAFDLLIIMIRVVLQLIIKASIATQFNKHRQFKEAR
jgi:hypothetical protein